MTIKYVIEKLKKNGQPYSIRQFIDFPFTYDKNRPQITTSLDIVKKYKTLGYITRRLSLVKNHQDFNSANLVLTRVEEEKLRNGIVFTTAVGHVESKKPKSRSKRTITRWQLIDLE